MDELASPEDGEGVNSPIEKPPGDSPTFKRIHWTTPLMATRNRIKLNGSFRRYFVFQIKFAIHYFDTYSEFLFRQDVFNENRHMMYITCPQRRKSVKCGVPSNFIGGLFDIKGKSNYLLPRQEDIVDCC